MKKSSSPAEIVSNIEELLKQILVRVPALSLIRFKCVSKHWLSLISDPDFRRLHTLQNPNPKISAFFSSETQDDSFNSLPLEIPHRSLNPFKALNKLETNLRILQSCNGLFLCQNSERNKLHPVYVVNPTTNQFRTLSSPKHTNIYAFVRYGLAFDPSKSPHYKVVCVRESYHLLRVRYQIDIYSSETEKWKHLNTRSFRRPSDEERFHFDPWSSQGPVYCNGAIHWISGEALLAFCSRNGRWDLRRRVMHFFDVTEEHLMVLASTTSVPLFVQNIPLNVDSNGVPTTWPSVTQRYFGECSGRLYLIEIFAHWSTSSIVMDMEMCYSFDVMEMKSDYSGWFFKYHVNLNPLIKALPGQVWNPLVVLGLSKNNGAEDSSMDLFLHLPGNVISCNLGNKTIKTIKTSVQLARKKLSLDSFEDSIQNGVSFPYIETLACL